MSLQITSGQSKAASPPQTHGLVVFASLCQCALHETAHIRLSWACQGMPFSLKIAPPMGICTPSNTWLLRSTRLIIPNSISIGSTVFVQLTAERPYTLQLATLSPQNYPFQWVILRGKSGAVVQWVGKAFGL